jgi:hypothetical protein
VNVHEWHRNGLLPAFGTIEQWIFDQLGYAAAEDEACYAVDVRDEKDRRGLAVRILIASDKGLFDLLWERPEDVAKRRLVSRHHRWADVRGVHLGADTSLDPQTLMHGEPRWRLTIADPEFTVDEATDATALLEFWTVCVKEMDKAAGG